MRNKSHLTIQSKGGMLKTQSAEGMPPTITSGTTRYKGENNERQRHCKKIKELSTAR